jgi:hypothetical protein
MRSMQLAGLAVRVVVMRVWVVMVVRVVLLAAR